jgi:hypothetical protein
MTEDWRDRCVGGARIEENLRRAVERGALIAHDDGTWSLAEPPGTSSYLLVKSPRDLGCGFSLRFLFNHAYAKAAAPYGCRACYKVKIVPTSLRGLVALRDLLERLDYQSKCGVDFYNPYSQEFYAGYLYCDGLEGARAVYRAMRPLIDADSRLGPGTGMTIKRGCSEFEAACGPADRYEFPEEMAAIETALRPRFRKTAKPPADYRIRRAQAMVLWIEFAFSIKDDTYLDFTGGRRLHPRTVAFPLEDAAVTPA